jgi:glyoxylase-like metal-dependent hydrolase (beta-lactamase superfamily II)
MDANALPDLPFTLQELRPGIFAALDKAGRAGANAGFVIGSEAVAVVDSFFREEAAEALLREIRARTPLPVRYVINTHHHIDHVAGNRVFVQAGALPVVQRNVAAWLLPENERLLGPRMTATQRAQLSLPPAIRYEQRLTLDLGGGRLLELRHELGHTGGDTVVSVEGVRFMGDLLWRAAVPNLIDADTLQWQQTLQRLDGGETYVPGHGGVATAQDLRDFAAYLQDLREIVREAGSDSERALAQLQLRYGSWAYFKGLAAANVRDAQAEREGRKRVPPVDTAPLSPAAPDPAKPRP